MILIFFIKHMHINVLGKLVTTKQLTLYFLRKSAKIIYNGLFPSFIFLFLRKWFQERMYFLSCWKTVFREKSCSFNWKLSSFSIPYSFNPIKVIVMFLNNFNKRVTFEWLVSDSNNI